MWNIIIFLLLITYDSTGTVYTYEALPQETFSLSKLNRKSIRLHDDIFLDKSDWRQKEESLLQTLPSTNMSDCSYVEKITNTNYTSGYMEIVVSPILIKKRMAFKQWVRIIFKVPYRQGDIIRLYNGTKAAGKPISETEVQSTTIHNIDIEDVYFISGEDYIAEYVRKNGEKVITSRFNTVKPSWMWCMKQELRSRILGKVFFPGTHDSGSYMSQPSWWKYKVFELYYQYIFTQGDSILSQLIQGARSFDLRVGKYNDKYTFYINHDNFKIRPFKQVLDQIKEFLTYSPNEIILLDFHRFPVGFILQSDHDQFVSFIKNELGDLIYWHPKAKTWDVKLEEIWKSKGRIIVAYNQEFASEKYNLFPSVEQIWGNTDDLSELIQYMDENIPKKKGCWGTSEKSTIEVLTCVHSRQYVNQFHNISIKYNIF